MVVVLIMGTREERYRANAKLAQLARCRQPRSDIAHVNIPPRCNGVAPQQGFVYVQQFPASASQNGFNQFFGLTQLLWGPVGNAHEIVLVCLSVKGFDLALEFHQQRIAFAVKSLACGHFNP